MPRKKHNRDLMERISQDGIIKAIGSYLKPKEMDIPTDILLALDAPLVRFWVVVFKLINKLSVSPCKYLLSSINWVKNTCLLVIFEIRAGEIFLPLHLCSISYLLTIVLLITNNEKIFVFVFFTGIIGGIVSFAIPEFGNGGYDRFRFYEFIIAHSAIIYVPIYYLTNYKYKIDIRRFIDIVIVTNVLGFFMLGVNFLLRATDFLPDANYMFTMGPPPEVESVFGVFPWHLFVFEAVLVISFYIIYFFGDRYSKKHIT